MIRSFLQPLARRIDGRAVGVIVLLYSSALLIYANVQKPRILVLHSYHTEFAWTRDVSVGIKRVLDHYSHYSIRWHHMDTKRHTDANFKEVATAQAVKLIDEWEPDVLIAVDDNAQSLVASRYVGHPRTQIVFSGVNGRLEKYGYDGAENVTGILERIALDAVKEALLEVLPESHRRMALITDFSPTSEHIQREILDYDWSPIEIVRHAMPVTFDEWKRTIGEMGEQADFVLFAPYHTIQRSAEEPVKVPPAEVMAWTQAHLALPGVGAWGYYVEDGGMLSVGVSPFEQGEEAAKRAVAIVERGARGGQLPVGRSKQFIVYAREPMLKAHDFRLPAVYESFARATNNYYEQ